MGLRATLAKLIAGKPKTGHEALKGAKPRSSRWRAYRDRWLKTHPTCAACGGKENLIVHHIYPFSWPGGEERELDESNFLSLCEADSHNCHLLFGHLLDWQSRNPNVRIDAADMLAEIRARPVQPKAETIN